MKKSLLLLSMFTSIVTAHPHHHSLAIAEYNTKSQQFEISLKLLSEDANKIIKTKSLDDYINQNLDIKVNDTLLSLKLEGKEIDPETTWFYLTANIACHVLNLTDNISVNNTLLHDKNENQFNTVKLIIGSKNTTHNFSVNEKKHVFRLSTNQLSCSNN